MSRLRTTVVAAGLQVYNLASGGGVATQPLAVTNPGNAPIRLASPARCGSVLSRIA